MIRHVRVVALYGLSALVLWVLTSVAMASQPSGLYLMTRIMGSSLEMQTWLFANGRFAQEPAQDISRFDFAAAERAAPGTTGAITISGDQWTLRWADGRSQTASHQSASPRERCFYWNAGLFCRVTSFVAGQGLDGTYSGSLGAVGVGASRAYRFTPDGRYMLEVVGSVITTSQTSGASASSTDSERGRYVVGANSIVLQPDGGTPRALTAFPYEAGSTPLAPQQFYLGGFMLTRSTKATAGAPTSTSAAACPERLPSGTSVLNCNCSAELTRSGGVWGTDVYTGDSAICRAALHAGVITSSGGPIRLRTVTPPAGFEGSTRNGTTTERWGSYPSAFVIEPPTDRQRK